MPLLSGHGLRVLAESRPQLGTQRPKHGGQSVVIVGAGMAGLRAARDLADTGAQVTLIDAHNYTTFPPMLFYVATAFLAPEDIVRPTRALLPNRKGISFELGHVQAIDRRNCNVMLDEGRVIPFDYLILAPGVVPAFGTVPGASEHAIPMNTPLDAARLRNNLIRSFEFAASHPEVSDPSMTSVAIIGGGPTGVEVAGYLADFLFRYSFPHDYPNLLRSCTRISLCELDDRLLPGLHPKLGHYALARLRRRGVEVKLSTKVASVDGSGLTLADGERVGAWTVVWAGGVGVADLVKRLEVPLVDGRIEVEPDLRITGFDNGFAIGDAAAIRSPAGPPYPQVAQIALQSGRHAARQISDQIAHKPTTPFHYHDKGTMAMVGRNAAIAEVGPIRLTGLPAWIAWGVLHLAYLPGVVNRLSAGLKFLLWHFTHDTNARILLERDIEVWAHPEPTPPEPG
jgi:NADH:quinone reductase (non-electrogenic)